MRQFKTCIICGKWFLPNKYRTRQEVCSNVECQYHRQLTNMSKWRGRNPHYFKYRERKDTTWKEVCRERSKRWRSRHREYLSLYRKENKERHREYMREYMREYRKMKKEEEKNNNNNQ